MRRPAMIVIAACAAVLVTGCGSSSLSVRQLRGAAAAICRALRRHADRIPAPSAPDEGARFIAEGIVTLSPGLTRLRRLRAPHDVAGAYRTALDAYAREMAALHSALAGLHAGNDPVVAVKTLQVQLAPIEAAAAGAWHTLDVPACLSLAA